MSLQDIRNAATKFIETIELSVKNEEYNYKEMINLLAEFDHALMAAFEKEPKRLQYNVDLLTASYKLISKMNYYMHYHAHYLDNGEGVNFQKDFDQQQKLLPIMVLTDHYKAYLDEKLTFLSGIQIHKEKMSKVSKDQYLCEETDPKSRYHNERFYEIFTDKSVEVYQALTGDLYASKLFSDSFIRYWEGAVSEYKPSHISTKYNRNMLVQNHLKGFYPKIFFYNFGADTLHNFKLVHFEGDGKRNFSIANHHYKVHIHEHVYKYLKTLNRALCEKDTKILDLNNTYALEEYERNLYKDASAQIIYKSLRNEKLRKMISSCEDAKKSLRLLIKLEKLPFTDYLNSFSQYVYQLNDYKSIQTFQRQSDEFMIFHDDIICSTKIVNHVDLNIKDSSIMSDYHAKLYPLKLFFNKMASHAAHCFYDDIKSEISSIKKNF